ncbi:Leucine rich repeat protein [Neochlamydia sp. S13]|nr:Leucine rich repeat protein [Neochlamydia sp. S13]
MQKLHLSDNLVNTLPIEIGQLFQVKHLNLDNNQLGSLPIKDWATIKAATTPLKQQPAFHHSHRDESIIAAAKL